MSSLPFRSTCHKYRKILRALVSRLILGAHAGLGLWWVASRLDKSYYGLMCAMFLLFIMETGVILYFRAGCEWKRFCTPFAVYLMSLVPALWVLKLNATQSGNGTSNTTNTGTSHNNNATHATGAAALVDDPTQIGEILGEDPGLSNLLAEENITSLLEQSMLIMLILCRWLLPRGRIDRSSLSQLLIMYSAIAADILDFSQIFDSAATDATAASGDNTFQYIVLGVWTWSLAQFTLVVTTSFHFRRRKVQRRSNLTNQNVDSDGQDKSEALSILMVFFMQDGPFLLVRLYAILVIKLQDFQVMFFSLKNALTLILGIYRLLVLCGCVDKEGNDFLTDVEVARSMESLDTIVDSSKCPKSKSVKKQKKQKKSTN